MLYFKPEKFETMSVLTPKPSTCWTGLEGEESRCTETRVEARASCFGVWEGLFRVTV